MNIVVIGGRERLRRFYLDHLMHLWPDSRVVFVGSDEIGRRTVSVAGHADIVIVITAGATHMSEVRVMSHTSMEVRLIRVNSLGISEFKKVVKP